jgi:APA family basic amino acid/polyamine antiporter
MIAYTGIETLSNMSEEARDAPRTVPAAVGWVIFAVISLYLLIPMVALSAMPVTQEPGGAFTTELATRYADNPMLGIVDNLGLDKGLREGLRVYVGVLAAIILVIATNAGLIGLSRLTFSMSQHRQLPEVIRTIHPRFRTPYVAIALFAAISAIALLPGETELLATMYAFGAMLSFSIAHVSVIKLRQRYPDRERPWKPPLGIRLRGLELPLTGVLGGLGTFAAWVVVMALNTRTLLIGVAWMAVGVAVYLLYRRRQGLPAAQTVKIVTPEPLGVEEVEYQSILVAFVEDPFSEEMVATADRLAARRRRGIHVLSLITVPTHLPLDAPLEAEESAAQSKIERAKLICGMRVTGHVERVRPGQAGHFIAGDARAIKAAALVVQLRYRNGIPLYGKTLEAVLTERPCRVIVVAEPGGARDGGTGGAPTRVPAGRA